MANNAILIAHGVTEVDQLPEADMQIGVLLALLQDDAKNQASWLTWQEALGQSEVAAVLRRDYLVSEERAKSLSGPWGRHPLLGRMCLPAYRAGSEKVALHTVRQYRAALTKLHEEYRGRRPVRVFLEVSIQPLPSLTGLR